MAGLIANMEGRAGDEGNINRRAGAVRRGAAAAAVGCGGDVLIGEANEGPGEKVDRIEARGDDADVVVVVGGGAGAGSNDVRDWDEGKKNRMPAVGYYYYCWWRGMGMKRRR